MNTGPRDPPSEMRSRCAVLQRCASPDPPVLAILLLSSLACFTERPSYWPPGKGKTVARPREQRWPKGRTGSFIND
ncbi:hypothetical protein AALO_G00235200 [Alosa alosa]|uniref:Uncharacterized protein n=1 Tax=Alosa alosa TaxID=278164 RepID=A0AAV6FZS4_9TELE|nr:hypothetical protein AALO_G00235200 [Alosa alosa]